jgi:hypothetical protein
MSGRRSERHQANQNYRKRQQKSTAPGDYSPLVPNISLSMVPLDKEVASKTWKKILRGVTTRYLYKREDFAEIKDLVMQSWIDNEYDLKHTFELTGPST